MADLSSSGASIVPAPRIPSGPERTVRVGFGIAVGLGEALGVAVGLWGWPECQRLTHGFEGSR